MKNGNLTQNGNTTFMNHQIQIKESRENDKTANIS